MSDTSSLKYRPDVDGLRALAVLPVIAFHLNLPVFSGGFVGVDIFFVISGYLITATLLSDIRSSRFSITKFYERRIRRIVPACFAMLLVTSILAGALFCPTDLKVFGTSLASAVLSVSNIYFWLQTGYFEPESTTRPLLHTWSLGVEEQFYIVFPLVLALLHRRVLKQLRVIVLLTAVVSLVVSMLSTAYAPASAFYLLPSRAWELMLGSMLSLEMFPAIQSTVRRNMIAVLGLALIVGAICFLTEATPFPGIAAILPCSGAFLLIAAGRSGGAFVSRCLSWAPIVFIGKISYSLYLWHWPLIVFQRTNGILSNGISHRAARFVFLPLLFVIATLSWRYVEQPFRTGGLRLTSTGLFRLAAVSATIGVALGLFFIGSGGLPQRYPPEALAVDKFLSYDSTESFRTGVCFLSAPSAKLAPVCLRRDQHTKTYLLFGDSHAAALWAGLSFVFPDVRFLQATASSCKPLMASKNAGENSGVFGLIKKVAMPTHPTPCPALTEYIFNDYLLNNRVDKVVLAANWKHTDLPSLTNTLTHLQARGFEVVLFGPIFEYDAPLPRLLANGIRWQQPDLPHQHFNQQQLSLDAEMSALAQTQWHVRYISYFRVFCKQANQCATYATAGVPLLFDFSHLTKGGSIQLATQLRNSHELP